MMPSAARKKKPKAKARTLSEVINGLKDAKGWSQARLAEEAGLSQPALSRLLSKEDAPKFGHLWSLAQALGVSVLQLASDAGIDDVISDVVPREHFIETDKKRVEAQHEVTSLRGQLTAKDVEIERLQDIGKQRAHELADAKGTIHQLEVVVSEVDNLRAETALLQVQVDHQEAAIASKNAELAEAKRARDEALTKITWLESLVKGMQTRAHQLQMDLQTAKGQTAAVGVVAGFAALGAGVWLAGKSEKKRK